MKASQVLVVLVCASTPVKASENWKDVREINPEHLAARALLAASARYPKLSRGDLRIQTFSCPNPDDPESCIAVIEFFLERQDIKTIEGKMCQVVTRYTAIPVYIDYYGREIVAPGESTGTSSSYKRCDSNATDDA